LQNLIVASYGPITDELKPLDKYKLTTQKNAMLQAILEEKLICFEVDQEALKQKLYKKFRKQKETLEAKKIGPTTRGYYKHQDTGEVFIIETNKYNIITASYGPITAELLPLEKYGLTIDNNAKLQAFIEDKLTRFEVDQNKLKKKIKKEEDF